MRQGFEGFKHHRGQAEGEYNASVKIPCLRGHPGAAPLVMLVLLTWLCGGCNQPGRKGAAAGSQGAAAATPLTQDDVNLYLEVMRTAAVRVNHMTPADKATLSRMNRLQTDIEAGRIPTPSEGDRAAEIIQRGLKLQSAMDEIIAEEKQMDVEGYTSVRDWIEGLVFRTGATSDETDVEGRPMTPAEIQTLLANKRVLAPYVPEIERLYQVVRIPK